MNKHTRRVVAYIAARIISGKTASSIYDYELSKYFNISGEVNDVNVNVYDYDQSCYVSGSRSSGEYSLYHYGNRKYIDLKINGQNFDGYDYDSKKHFSGNVNTNSISLYDYEDRKYHNLSL